LESKEVLLVNCVGEYIVISIQEFNALLTNPFAIHSDTFKLLKCKNFFTDYDLELAIEMLATKLRTRKAFLRNFTSLHMVVLTAHCNGRCDYCHASSSDVAKGPLSQNMRPDVADAVVDMIFMSPSQYIKIEFQGGEPLINWEVLVRIVHRTKKINKTANKKLEFVVCTNMTLLDYDKAKFLMKEGIQISTSLDGPKELHDLHRKMRDGSSSYDKFIENLSIVCRVMEAESVSPLLTITRDHLKRLPEVIDEYIRLGFKGIFLRSLNPYGFAREDLAALGYSMEEFIEAYKEGFDYILQKNRNGVHFVEYFATLILSRILTPFSTRFVDLQFPAGAGISGVIYDYDGCVYPSDEARMLARTGDKKFLLGNVIDNSYEEIFEGNKLKSIISMSCAEVMPGCTSCVYQAYCGSDPVRNYVESGDVMGFRPSSDFCKKNMGIIDFLFKYILENNEQVMDIFWSWITGRSLEDVRL